MGAGKHYDVQGSGPPGPGLGNAALGNDSMHHKTHSVPDFDLIHL